MEEAAAGEGGQGRSAGGHRWHREVEEMEEAAEGEGGQGMSAGGAQKEQGGGWKWKKQLKEREELFALNIINNLIL